MFLLPFGMFPRLYTVHQYYPVACGIFLILGVGSLMGRHSYLSILLVALQLWSTHHGLIPKPNDASIVSAHYLRDHTPKDGVVLIYGMEWNPALCYYAERRCVMMTSLIPENISVDPSRMAAIIDCRGSNGCTAVFR